MKRKYGDYKELLALKDKFVRILKDFEDNE